MGPVTWVVLVWASRHAEAGIRQRTVGLLTSSWGVACHCCACRVRAAPRRRWDGASHGHPLRHELGGTLATVAWST
eukprot:4398199-Prymnesium_polylepis.1